MEKSVSRDHPIRTAKMLAQTFSLSPHGKKQLTAEQTPAQFLRALVHCAAYVDAIRLMSVALLPREAVWWGCLCCQHTLTAKKTRNPVDVQTLKSAVGWVIHADELHRKAAEQAGITAGSKSPYGYVAQAAALGGVANSPEQSVQPTQPAAMAKLVAASVLLAGQAGSGSQAELFYRQFIALGIDVDNHLCHWNAGSSAK